jgi:hypothetical protein
MTAAEQNARGRPASSAPRRRRLRASTPLLPLAAGGLVMLFGLALRAPILTYAGPRDQGTFFEYLMGHLGSYTDIGSLYFRDQLWRHPVPYLDYPLEYPVGLGLAIWLTASFGGSVQQFMLASASHLVACGLLTIGLARRLRGANPWLLALSPALALYVVLSWDLLGILPMVGALLLFRSGRDGWGALVLAIAIWAKFFPLLLVPLVLTERLFRRRRSAAAIAAILLGASLAINLPFAIELTPDGWGVRDGWRHFFALNRERPHELNLWNLFDGLGLSTDQVNLYSGLLLAAGLIACAAIAGVARPRDSGRAGDTLLPATLAAVGWFFFVNKVYSPQYSLWLVALLALCGAPPALAVAFWGVDVAYFVTSFVVIQLAVTGDPNSVWFGDQVLWPSMVVREATILAIVAWAVARTIRERSRPAGCPADPPPASLVAGASDPSGPSPGGPGR